jgi:hypothetical protein
VRRASASSSSFSGVADGTELTRQVATLRAAVAAYQHGGSLAQLDQAFLAAAGVVATLRGERAAQPPSVEEVSELFARLPEFERLVAIAVGEADRSARDAGARLWQSFGLRSDPPRWSDEERWRAALLVACACAPLSGHGRGWLRERLLSLAAARWARLLVRELQTADEALWIHALGPRYASVHRRCAPRSNWRTLGLSDLVRSDPRVGESLQQRLAGWLAGGGSFEVLPAELEAALVHGRTPARLA